MIKFLQDHKLFLLLALILSAFYLSTLHLVPFHPDESTQIYMSQDFVQLFQDPLSMVWVPGQPPTPETRLRKLDAPLTRYLIGFGRTLTGTSAVEANWDWGKSWHENVLRGAFPSPETLWVSRAAVSMLLPLSLSFFYLFVNQISNRHSALVGTLLLGINPLFLLHGRRAMAEGAILLGVSFFIWTMIYGKKFPWLVGLAFALAYNAKQSTLALLPAGIIAVSWFPRPFQHLSKLIKNNLIFLGAWLIPTYLLNPILWRYPLQAMIESWQTRLSFTQQQVQTIRSQAANRVLDGLFQRALSLVNNLFLNRPSIADVGNYLGNTTQTETAYFNLPFTTFGRGLIPGGIFFALMIGGIYLTMTSLDSYHGSRKRTRFLLLSAFFIQTSALLIAVPLTWQRYVIPLLPFVTAWIALGIDPLLSVIAKSISSTTK